MIIVTEFLSLSFGDWWVLKMEGGGGAAAGLWENVKLTKVRPGIVLNPDPF